MNEKETHEEHVLPRREVRARADDRVLFLGKGVSMCYAGVGVYDIKKGRWDPIRIRIRIRVRCDAMRVAPAST